MEHFSILKTERDAYPMNFDPLGFIKSYIHTVLTTSYLYTFAIFNVLFYVNALLIVFVMENFFPNVKTFPGFIYLLDTITFLPGFVYMNFLNQVLNGYTSGVRNYLDYLQRIERIAMHCDEKKLSQVYPMLLTLVDLGNNFRGKQLPQYAEFFAQANPTREIKSKISKMSFAESIRYVIGLLKREFSNDMVADQETNQLFEKIQELETGSLVSEPIFMHDQNMILLFAWYCVWVPITLWVQVGGFVTVILFPIISYILWGTAIQRVWLSSAWDNARPFRESEHEQWPEHFKDSIEKICQFRTGNKR